MKYDLLIKNGTIIDGTGRERFEGDVGIVDDQIEAIGNLGTSATEVIDARDRIVSPGFVDAHTHMDAQIFWDPLGTCSCEHGVTSVVMGNCGFTLAPVNGDDIEMVLENLEEAEAIPADVLAAGVDFRWRTFPEFLDVLDDLPKGINYAGYVGHSALRTFAMRERAFTDTATNEDLTIMADALRDGLRAGAVGLSTTRNPSHIRPGGEPVVSRVANWSEVEALVGVMSELNKGIFEISREGKDPLPTNDSLDFNTRLKRLAIDSRRPVTLGIFSVLSEPDLWRTLLSMVEQTNAEGGRMVAQVHSNTMYEYHSLRAEMPFDSLPAWADLKHLSHAEQRARLGNESVCRELMEAARSLDPQPDYSLFMPVESLSAPDVSVAERAAQSGKDPLTVIIEHLRNGDGDQFFRTPFANQREQTVLDLIEHPNSVVTFSDSGAHVSQIADFSLHTHFLSHWVRRQRALSLEEAVRRITSDVADNWGFSDRGSLVIGKRADVAIFDADNIAPLMPTVANDLPLNGVRIRQGATGIDATVVNGEVLMRDGQHTGALPGRLLRQ